MTNTPDFLYSLGAESTPVAEVEKPEKVEKPIEQEFEEEESEDEREEGEETEIEESKPKATKAEKEPAPAAGGEKTEAAGFKAGMLAERKKRQELEKKLQEIEKKQKQPEPAPRPVSFREDPEKFVVSAVQSVEARHMNALEADMREQHEDFDEMAELVVKAAEMNPTLRQQVFEAGNPARAMYRLGKQLQEAEKLKDPEVYKASIRDEVVAEVTARLREELGLGTPEAKPARTALPRDLSNGRSGTDTVATTAAVDPRRGEFVDLFDPRRPPS